MWIPHMMAIPGRIAALLVASILMHGFLFRSGQLPVLSNSSAFPSTTFMNLIEDELIRNEATASITSSSSSSSPTVAVVISMEALCIDTKRYFQEQLGPAWSVLGPQVMDLAVIPFGNAHLNISAGTRSIQCQHGVAECDANSYQQCAVDIYPFPSRYMPFFQCLFTSLPMGYSDKPFAASVFASCAQQSALDWSSLVSCHHNMTRSWQLQIAAWKRTPHDHTYVPWVVVDGHHIQEDAENTSLLLQVCQAYQNKGGSHPGCPYSETLPHNRPLRASHQTHFEQ